MGGFRLGSVLGFEIRIDYSWFIIFFLILWTFVRPEQSMTTVVERFSGVEDGRILVVRGEELRGIITRADLARWIERAEMLAGT